MSQYQDYFFSDGQRQEDYSILNSPCIDEKRIEQVRFLIDNGFYKEPIPTEDYPEFTETYFKNTNQIQIHNSSIIRQTKRIKRNINLTQTQIQKRKQIFKGLKDDTTQLNINLKTILFNHLKDMSLSREFDRDDTELIKQYGKQTASFGAIKKVCISQRIRQKGLKYIKSAKMLNSILMSHSKFQNKLTLIKYLQCVRKNFEQEKVTRWKDTGLG